MNNTFGIYKKLVLTFNVLDSVDLLPVAATPPHKYVGARKEGSQGLRYYKAGFIMMRIDDFVREYGSLTIYRPMANYVLLISLNKSTVADGKMVVKVRNKVQLILPVEIGSVRDGDRVFNDPGLSVDPTVFDYNALFLNVFTGAGELTVRVAEVKAYVETPDDVLRTVRTAMDPIINKMTESVGESIIRMWQTTEGEMVMLGYIKTLLTKTGIFNALADDGRMKLSRLLADGIAAEAVSNDDVTWDSKQDMDFDIKAAGGDVELAKARRRTSLRLSYLMDNCTMEQRLKEMTRAEIENTVDMTSPNITMVMTDEELESYFGAEDREVMAEIEFNVLARYMEAHK